jgi:hypothetical protein
MPIRVSEAIDTDTAEMIIIQRQSGSYIDGIYTRGLIVNIKCLASVQQPDDKELQRLPEGQRDKDLRKFISVKPIFTVSDRDGSNPDIVVYKGAKYEIINSADWDSYGQTTAVGVRVK